MRGKIFVTSSGYDPEKGKHVKDPYLGPNPSLGACRPDIREKLVEGDRIFVVSGKIKNASQFVMGGFAISEKISAIEAYERFPEQRLRLREDGQLTGNIIVDSQGNQHELDRHNQFDRRIKNYVVGKSRIVLSSVAEIAECRRLTLDILADVFGNKGNSIREIMGRWRNLSEKQVEKLISRLKELKVSVHQPMAG